jgi:hypothetical protein
MVLYRHCSSFFPSPGQAMGKMNYRKMESTVLAQAKGD